jgi:3-carboxy-cis,cis-muconate cycloisomerase
VKQLTAIVKQNDEDAARYVHWGATSQDILDTACILQCRAAMTQVEALIHQCYRTALTQAEQYRSQVMIGRTWLQQGLPITLGHKFESKVGVIHVRNMNWAYMPLPFRFTGNS